MAIVTNWIPLSGNASVENGIITYNPVEYQTQSGENAILSCIIKSDTYFSNGEININVVFLEKDATCQIILNHDSNPWIVIGSNSGSGLWEINKAETGKQIETLSTAGEGSELKLGVDYQIKITVIGSQITMYVNGISILYAQQPVFKSQLALFLHSTQQIIVKEVSVESVKLKAFIVMQFSEEYNNLYKEVIKPIVESYGLICERADEVHTTNPILQDIVTSIKESYLIIAEITPSNPNVFYEVGYAHAINKTTILLCDRNREKLPFDLSGFRTLFYENTIPGKTAVEQGLKKYLNNIFGSH